MKKLAIKYISIILFIIILISISLFYLSEISISKDLNDLISMFWKILVNPIFKIGNTSISILNIIIAILIFSAGFIIGKLYKKNIKKITHKYTSINRSTLTIISNIGYYLIIIFAFFIGLNILGINLSSIALIAGALSVGIGFGLQNVVSNFISGIILMFEHSIKIGDYIELSDGIKGRVKDIRMRSITITTNSNIDIIIPNQYFIQNNVINWTMEDMIRRFEIPFGVAYGTDPQKVITVIEEAVKKSNFPDVIDTPDKKTRVVMTGFGDSSINFELFVWIQGPEISYPKRTKSRFLILIYKTLNENNIEIPFPQRDLHVRSIDEDIIKKLNITES
ncbi:mechanosensitive ion channel family protein [Hydrogenothermus marinus]|uniref:Mechanosensitive ion channel-like protein n=1 Tax=Hydrogenothermus marinus TaxID=133270 RepID=A0A3M0BP12_9AQUI|nr:mechanosensitive ion channel domain-containing protein [Hydrogenothermus marinus]RMA96175.1 mechanosensitive ion channel-like protein [Hydrogenothermus marinus]